MTCVLYDKPASLFDSKKSNCCFTKIISQIDEHNKPASLFDSSGYLKTYPYLIYQYGYNYYWEEPHLPVYQYLNNTLSLHTVHVHLQTVLNINCESRKASKRMIKKNLLRLNMLTRGRNIGFTGTIGVFDGITLTGWLPITFPSRFNACLAPSAGTFKTITIPLRKNQRR